MCVQQQIQRPFQENLKSHQQHSASTAFPTSLLSAFASLPNHFFKTPSFFDGGHPVPPPPPPKTPVMARTIVEMVIERAVSIGNWLYPIHEIRYEFFLLKMYLYQELFQRFA